MYSRRGEGSVTVDEAASPFPSPLQQYRQYTAYQTQTTPCPAGGGGTELYNCKILGCVHAYTRSMYARMALGLALLRATRVRTYTVLRCLENPTTTQQYNCACTFSPLSCLACTPPTIVRTFLVCARWINNVRRIIIYDVRTYTYR